MSYPLPPRYPTYPALTATQASNERVEKPDEKGEGQTLPLSKQIVISSYQQYPTDSPGGKST